MPHAQSGKKKGIYIYIYIYVHPKRTGQRKSQWHLRREKAYLAIYCHMLTERTGRNSAACSSLTQTNRLYTCTFGSIVCLSLLHVLQCIGYSNIKRLSDSTVNNNNKATTKKQDTPLSCTGELFLIRRVYHAALKVLELTGGSGVRPPLHLLGEGRERVERTPPLLCVQLEH